MQAGATYRALWKMIPRADRRPEWTVLTPCRIATRLNPRAPGTGRWRGGEDHSLAALEIRDCRPRLCTGPLLHEDVLTAGEVRSRGAQHDRRLKRERDVAVHVLMQAVVTARVIGEKERRRSVLTGAGAHGEELVERAGERRVAELLGPAVGDRRERWIQLHA